MSLEIVSFGPSDAESWGRYRRLFEACPQAPIQLSAEWAEAIQGLGPDKPVFLLAREQGEDIAGMPLYLFESPRGNILSSVPQAGPLGGIFCRPGTKEDLKNAVYRGMLEKMAQAAAASECIAATVITNPFENDLPFYERHMQFDFTFENFTQAVYLDREAERSHGVRNNLNKSKKQGLAVRACGSDAEFRAWYEIHRARHTEIGAAPLDVSLFAGLRAALEPEGKAVLFLVFHQGRTISGCLMVRHRDVADVFMLSLDSRFEELKANFFLMDHCMQWAREQGCRIFNWQSSQSRESGVYSFKKQWGSVELPYYFLTKLFCEPSRIEKTGLEAVRAAYPGHYVLPFAAFTQGFGRRHFKKGENA